MRYAILVVCLVAVPAWALGATKEEQALEKFLANAFKSADKNKDESLDKKEMGTARNAVKSFVAKAIPKKLEGRDQIVKELNKLVAAASIDGDNDGSATADELKEFVGNMIEKRDGLLEEAKKLAEARQREREAQAQAAEEEYRRQQAQREREKQMARDRQRLNKGAGKK